MEVRQSHSIFFLQFYYVYVFTSVFIVSTGFCELTLLSRLIWNVYWAAGGSLCLCVYVNICLRSGAGAIWPLSTVIWNIERSWTSLSCSVPSTVVDVVGRLSSPPHTLPLSFRVIVFYSLIMIIIIMCQMYWCIHLLLAALQARASSLSCWQVGYNIIYELAFTGLWSVVRLNIRHHFFSLSLFLFRRVWTTLARDPILQCIDPRCARCEPQEHRGANADKRNLIH